MYMFLLCLTICFRVLLAGSSTTAKESSFTNIDVFELYAGNMIYTNGNDGSCIACNGSCTKSNAVSPHSWTAELVYISDNETYYNNLEACKKYVKDVAHYGVAAFTWNNITRSCSLHVLGETFNFGEEMKNYNGFTWIEENQYNTGPLFLVRYPKKTENVNAFCYYGLHVNHAPSIARQTNQLIIALVVVMIISWKGWMNHTDNHPPAVVDDHLFPEKSDDSSNAGYNIYRHNTYAENEE